MQKTVNIEAKKDLKSNIIVWDLDFCYFKGYCLFYNTLTKM